MLYEVSHCEDGLLNLGTVIEVRLRDLLYPPATRFGSSAARRFSSAIMLPSIPAITPLCLWGPRIVCHSCRQCRAHGQNLSDVESNSDGGSIVLYESGEDDQETRKGVAKEDEGTRGFMFSMSVEDKTWRQSGRRDHG